MKIKTGHGTISLMLLLAIYSISMVTSLPGLGISPILGRLENIFKEASELQLQLLESLPSFIIVPFILISGRLSLRINKKKLLITGLTIFSICSIIYPLAKSLPLLLWISAFLGIGSGLVIPFSTGLVADYFSGPSRTRQLGYVSAINNLSLILATLFSGYLAGINWHYSFLVYCLAGISLFFSFFLDPCPPDTSPEKSSSKQSSKFKWPVKLMLFYFFITFLALAIPLNLALYMHNLKIGTATTAGNLISVFFLAVTLPGFFLNRIIRLLKEYTNILSLAAISVGLLFFTLTGGLALLTLGTALIGLGYGIMQPIIYDKTANSVSKPHAIYVLSLVMVMNYIAIVVYPFIISIFSSDSAYFPFLLCTILGMLFTLFAFFRKKTAVIGMQV